eukprot:GHRR01010907.1.p1 GENE.GHRR01010907.1~~GHRR01010907.1.p1  ORF type:complete len:359 (+),score=175.27 GHRR01010907.1:313-1389(+)
MAEHNASAVCMLLLQQYFHHQATVIQKHWRGYCSRSRVHDFYKRKAYLAAVAAANAATRADMAASLQNALRYQQQQAEQAAKQHFDVQVSRLHHLVSTASSPGIFNPPAAAATGELPRVACLPLEHHLRTASRQQAAKAVQQQQATLQNTISNSSKAGFQFPAGLLSSRMGLGLDNSSSLRQSPDSSRFRSHCSISSEAANAVQQLDSSIGNLLANPQQSSRKLASLVVAAVDDAYAARAEPNMPDGTFNPGLSLQQAAGFTNTRAAGELEKRVDKSLMLALHAGQPFNTSAKLASQPRLEPLPAVEAAKQQQQHSGTASSLVAGKAGSLCRTGSPQRDWTHNKHDGAFFDKHLKQAY